LWTRLAADLGIRPESNLPPPRLGHRCGGFPLGGFWALHFIAGQKFAGELKISLGSTRTWVVQSYRFAVAGSFGKPHVARDYRLEQPLLEVLTQGLCHLLSQVRAVVIHGQ